MFCKDYYKNKGKTKHLDLSFKRLLSLNTPSGQLELNNRSWNLLAHLRSLARLLIRRVRDSTIYLEEKAILKL